MRALVCKSYGTPDVLSVDDFPAPEPKPGEVVIGVEAAGVNFIDVLAVAGKYQNTPPLPFVPGFEAAGTIRRLGEGVTGWKVGDRVMAQPKHGSFAEAVTVGAKEVVRLPPNFDAVTGAAFMMAYGTALYALTNRGNLRAGETVLVLGAAGGVGSALVETAKTLGARVIAAASTPEKLAFCKSLGADEGVNYTTENLRDRLKELTGGKGVDVVCDNVGGPAAEPSVRSMAWGGRYLVIGFAQGEIPRIPLNLVLLKSCALVGVSWGAFVWRGEAEAARHLEELGKLAASGKVKPRVAATYSLADGPQALNDLAARRVHGKFVIIP